MKREKPPIECRTGNDLEARDDDGIFFLPHGGSAFFTKQSAALLDVNDTRIIIDRTDFDSLVRWYTGTEPKQPRATKGTR